MRDHIEKYLEIQMLFPNKAGKLAQVLTVQKRLAEQLAKRPQDDDTKRLLIAVAEGHDVAFDLLEWFKTQLQEVCNDARTLSEGAKMRNIMDDQGELLRFYMDNDESSHVLRSRK
jgi:hypothetical protein